MSTSTRIKKWGNSFGVIIPKAILAQLNVSNPSGQKLRMNVSDGKLIIEPQKLPSSIEELFAGFDYKAHNREHHQNEELDFGAPVGHEIW
mgnify:CR=1 FL=1